MEHQTTTHDKDTHTTSTTESSERVEPPYWTNDRVRQTFIKFFVDHDHVIVPPSSVVPPPSDTSLLFTNSGMVQFKPFFLGQRQEQLRSESRPQLPVCKLDDLHYSRVCNSQRCIRVGGKHNDLDDVGKDGYHHTLFEMLGNWSFNGNYFKKQIIDWSWELLTKVYGLNTDNLYVTYFGGNDKEGLQPDTETRDLWLRHLPPGRVLPFGSQENFWEMGSSGPCGPCTEIHFDRTGGRFVPDLVNKDDPTVIELWNLVFMQYNRDEQTGRLSPLPSMHVDTGLGLERLTSVLQKVPSNYDTDVFRSLFHEISVLTSGRFKYGGRFSSDDPDMVDTSFRVISDHVRCLTVMIHDGVLPGSKSRNYMVRRLVRRGVFFGKTKLGLNSPDGWLYRLVPTVMESLGRRQCGGREGGCVEEFYLSEEMKLDSGRTETIMQVIKEEEMKFEKTWEKGRRKYEKEVQGMQPGETIPGDLVWNLHETFGIYVDITEILSLQRGLLVDRKGFEESLEKGRSVSQQQGGRK